MDAEIVMQLHDEIIMEVDERSIEECAKALKDCMEKAFPAFSTKFPVKLSSGKSWGSMRPFSI